jgi:DNA topoisomerase-1
MKLVIVESPAKCGKIQGFLGDGYQVMASMGHIRALEEKLEAIGMDKGWEPSYRFLEEKARTLHSLREAAKGAEQVYLAADDDREGEAIAYSVALLLKLPLRSTPRIVFHEITEKAIKAAMAAPRFLDMNRIHSQQARAMLDMMIGFTLSPLLWNHVARGLSAGRCQTPALRLVVEREQEIEAFKGVSSWKLTGEWATVATAPATSFKLSGAMIDALADEESALVYLENHSTDRGAIVRSNVVKPWSASPPAPLITSTLQQQASALYSLAPKATMQIAQKLYEGGHITYMRTDKAVLSEEAVGAAHTWIREMYGEEYVGAVAAPASSSEEGEKEKPKKGKKAKRGDEKGGEEGPKAQEAHEAIRPTHMELVTIAGLEPLHAKLYGLIRQRAVQSCMAAACGETCTMVFDAEGDDGEFGWKAAWKRTTFPGWQRLGRVAALEENEKGEGGDEEVASSEDEATGSWERAVALKAGAALEWQSLTAAPHETKPPTRFTEATLVRELEHFGIGRPSTFSSLIAAIQDRGYTEVKDIAGKEVAITTYSLKAINQWPPTATAIKKKIGQEKQKLVPTELGRHALAFLLKHFPALFDFKFTAAMEAHLDAIANAGEPWKRVLEDTWTSYKDTYEGLKGEGTVAGAGGGGLNPKVRVLDETTGLKAVLSKKGPLLLRELATGAGAGAGAKAKATAKTSETTAVFYGWPAGIPFESITLEQANAFVATAAKAKEGELLGEWKGNPVIKRVGKFGPYVVWGDVRLTLKAGDVESIEAIGGRLDAVAAAPAGAGGILRTFKEYEIKVGQYGPYIYKPALKKRQFVSVPKGTKIEDLKESEVAELYKKGLELKKTKAPFAKKPAATAADPGKI